MKKIDWYAVLLAARKISERGEDLTSTAIAEETGIQTKVASAWLSNFYHWGYTLKDGKVAAGGRWSWKWRLTRWGMECKAKRTKRTLRIAANPPRNQG